MFPGKEEVLGKKLKEFEAGEKTEFPGGKCRLAEALELFPVKEASWALEGRPVPASRDWGKLGVGALLSLYGSSF